MSHWSDAHCHLQEQFLGDEATTAKLAALEKRVRVLEERLTPPETRAGEP